MKFKGETEIKDKVFKIYITKEQIQSQVEWMAEMINRNYGMYQKILIVGVLNGSFMFTSDLVRNIRRDCEVIFMKVSSYQGMGSSGEVSELIGLDAEKVNGSHVLLIEDIVDTGLTMKSVLKKLDGMSPKSVRLASLLFKPDSFKEDYKVDYIGFSIPNDFVVGYGMDYDGEGRNLPDIYVLKK